MDFRNEWSQWMERMIHEWMDGCCDFNSKMSRHHTANMISGKAGKHTFYFQQNGYTYMLQILTARGPQCIHKHTHTHNALMQCARNPVASLHTSSSTQFESNSCVLTLTVMSMVTCPDSRCKHVLHQLHAFSGQLFNYSTPCTKCSLKGFRLLLIQKLRTAKTSVAPSHVVVPLAMWIRNFS